MNEFRIRLDAVLGHVTLYKLVVVGLLAISAMALLLMFSGYLPYSPLSFLTSIAVTVGAAYGSNRLFGWLFGVRPHADSAIITGLILSLLFLPPVTFAAGLKLAIVAAIAMASKYVINIRGKHVFNPAAIAIVIASISGFAFAGWWVASPGLLPVTIIVALLILYKTQKMTMAATFLLVAITIIFVRLLFGGLLTPENMMMALTSWPLVFFAGVMLCEPLTLPPTRKQQLIFAVVVGCLVAIPLHQAGVSTTPAVALVVGNLLAFYFSVRRAVKMRFVAKKKESRDAYEFTFDVPKFAYEPGQYVELSLPHDKPDFRGSRRVFSVIGQPHDEQLSIATRFPVQHSSFKEKLMNLKAGKTVWGLRVAGDFTMPRDESVPLLCVAGGIGITPFVSFAMNAGNRDITILYSVNSVEDLAFTKELAKYNVKVVVVTDDDAKLPVHDWHHEKGRVSLEILRKYMKSGGHIYVSGPPAMVTGVAQMAHEVGAVKVHTDHFAGY
jgi:ferredoxin-NADP reductase